MKTVGITIIAFLFLFSVCPGLRAGEEDSIGVLVFFPGGPEESRVAPYLEQLAGVIAEEMKAPPSLLSGRYFSRVESALSFLRDNPDCFIISSPGFFLSRQEELKLVPLAAIEMEGGGEDRYHLIARKGWEGGLEAMKGKVVSGNILYDDPVFLRTLVFDNRLDPEGDLVLEPTTRPLTAIRRLDRGEIDGVLLDDIQYESLRSLPLFAEVDVIYRSPPLPEVGLMMVDTPLTRQWRERILAALTTLGETEAGGGAFTSFGLKGFRPIDSASLQEAIGKYQQGVSKIAQ